MQSLTNNWLDVALCVDDNVRSISGCLMQCTTALTFGYFNLWCETLQLDGLEIYMRIPCQSNPTRDICTFCTCEHLISIPKNRNTNKILCGSGNWTLLKQSFDILFSCLDFLYIGIFERGKDTQRIVLDSNRSGTAQFWFSSTLLTKYIFGPLKYIFGWK